MPGMLAKGPFPLPSIGDCAVGGQTTCPLDQEPCGWVVEGSGHQTGEGAPVPGWPLTLTQASRGQCRVPGLSLSIPFGQQGPRKRSFNKDHPWNN